MKKPAEHGGVAGLINHTGKIQRYYDRFETALFGLIGRPNCFATFDSHTNTIYSTTHSWNITGAYGVRFVTGRREDHYQILQEAEQFGISDVTMSPLQTKISNRAPIFPRKDFQFNLNKRYGFHNGGRLTSLLDGSKHEVLELVTLNEIPSVRINVTTHPGHSGLGFVDELGELYIVSCGEGESFETTILSHVKTRKRRIFPSRK